MRALSRLVYVISVAILALSLSSCGSANPNDQGMAFTLIGWSDSGTEPNRSGASVTLGVDTETEPQPPGVLIFAIIQNNLTNQGIRTDRALISYYVEGASTQPPSTTQAFPAVLGPAASTTGGGGTTAEAGGTSSAGGSGVGGSFGEGSLPPGFTSIANLMGVEFPIVPPDVMAWLNLNRNALPELPFQMTAYVVISGVTTAGNRIETNMLPFPMMFNADQVITPESGGGSSTGTTNTDTTATDATQDTGTGTTPSNTTEGTGSNGL